MRYLVVALLAACGFHPAAAVPGKDASSGSDAAPPVDAGPADAPWLVGTYFVDYAAGDDASDGKTQQTAWKHAPGDAAATLAPKAAALQPGDVVLFKAGVTYHGTFGILASGAAGMPVVYAGAADGQWGTGIAHIDAGGATLGIRIVARSYVRLDNLAISDFSKASSSTAVFVQGGDHVEVSRNQISDVYYASNPAGTTAPWAIAFGAGIGAVDSQAVWIHDNTIRDCGFAGIYVNAFTTTGNVDGDVVEHNDLSNMNRGMVLATTHDGAHLTALHVIGNRIHDHGAYVPMGTNRDGIEVLTTGATSQISGAEIADNYFSDHGEAFDAALMNAWIYATGNTQAFDIHHNVFNAAPTTFQLRFASTSTITGNHRIESNVFANQNGGNGTAIHIDHETGVQLVNNVFADDNEAYEIETNAMTGFAADYNLLYRPTGTSVARLDCGPASNPGGTQETLAGLQAAGYEAHGVSADPAFATPVASIDADPRGFRPAAGSPAIGAGTLTPFTTDFLGTAIPIGMPDIGAFEQ